MSRSPLDCRRHILDELEYLMRRSRGLTSERFLPDQTLKRAFIRSLEVTGEATRHVPADFKGKHRQVDWRAMAGMRDRLIQECFGVDYDIVWHAVTNKAPVLCHEITKILDEESRPHNG